MTTDATRGALRDAGPCAAVARSTTLDPNAGYVTMLNTYEVAPERSKALLDLLVFATEKILRYVPGFVSANFHVSFDRTEVLNYAQWRSREAIMAARNNPSVAALMNEASEIADSFNPILCELRLSVSAAAT
jgi:C-6 monooxygenase